MRFPAPFSLLLSFLLCLTSTLVARTPHHIVCLAVEDPDNYDAVTFLRGFAENELRSPAYRVTLVEGNHARPTDFGGLVAALETADLLIVFVRRATPPPAQLDAIRSHLEAGRALLGIRTANHAFLPPANEPEIPPGLAAWPEFVPGVLGCRNTGYETKGMPYGVVVHPRAPAGSPLLAGVNAAAIRGQASLYRVLPLAEDAVPLLLGKATGIEPAQPVAWTRRYGPKQARIFYTSLGAPGDVSQPDVRRLIQNAVNWTLSRDS